MILLARVTQVNSFLIHQKMILMVGRWSLNMLRNLISTILLTVTKLIIILRSHVNLRTRLWGNQHNDQHNAVLKKREPQRIPKSKDLKLFCMLEQRNLLFLYRLITTLTELIIFHIRRYADKTWVIMFLCLLPYLFYCGLLYSWH